ncbi:hypothetical protein [Nitrospirillum amazonense]|uniref:hypothetical protein n=1 Tax=Nitrospirillum amazonense TaxID=28077 RepID=UPI002412E03D|nr:hypothetical protein [Nitrospirillum amazonense]MDG3444684.1 hypothetical protein [Nitrospirillum amazonense]
MEVRNHDWMDTETLRPLYGLEVFIPGTGWCFVARGGEPLLFDTEAERTAERKRMEAAPYPKNPSAHIRGVA